jgi:hypothetical protein
LDLFFQPLIAPLLFREFHELLLIDFSFSGCVVAPRRAR